MKPYNVCIGLASLFALTLPTELVSSQNKPNVRYVCSILESNYTTIAITSKGHIQMIKWLDKSWGSKWTPKDRCEAVTSRFQTHSDKGNLNYEFEIYW